MAKELISPKAVRAVFLFLIVVTLGSPSLGLALDHFYGALNYILSSVIWWVWVVGTMSSLFWAFLFLKREPGWTRACLAAVFFSVLIGALVPPV